jgi:hypothetical protein
MVRTLVLTVDRDNDLGIKTAIRGPVICRKQVLTAALRLGIADPEESDTNAIPFLLKVCPEGPMAHLNKLSDRKNVGRVRQMPKCLYNVIVSYYVTIWDRLMSSSITEMRRACRFFQHM